MKLLLPQQAHRAKCEEGNDEKYGKRNPPFFGNEISEEGTYKKRAQKKRERHAPDKLGNPRFIRV